MVKTRRRIKNKKIVYKLVRLIKEGVFSKCLYIAFVRYNCSLLDGNAVTRVLKELDLWRQKLGRLIGCFVKFCSLTVHWLSCKAAVVYAFANISCWISVLSHPLVVPKHL